MAKKKAAIGDLIKSDMSRRAIGEEPKTVTKPKPLPGEPKKTTEKKPAAVKAETPVATAAPVTIPVGDAGFAAFISTQTQSVGLTNETDLLRFYDFLQGQALRYIRGFDAGRRFHG